MKRKQLPIVALAVCLLVVLALPGCWLRKPTYRLAGTARGFALNTPGHALISVWEQQLGQKWAIDTIGTGGSIENLQELINGQVDFAFIQNDATIRPADTARSPAPYQGDVRTVLPMFQEVMFIIYRKGQKAKTLEELVRGKRVCVGPRYSATGYIARRVFEAQGIPPDSYKWVNSSYIDNRLSDTIDIVIQMASPHGPLIGELLSDTAHAALWSLDDPEKLGKGSIADGFVLGYPMARPYLLPARMFPVLAAGPALTIAVDNVLVTRASTDETLVYDLVNTLLEQKRTLAELSPILQNVIETVQESQLHYPLHQGTRNYLARNEPPVVARYAELISLIITLLSVGYGGIVLLGRRRQERIRQRMQGHYQEVMELEATVPRLDDLAACDAALHSLHELRTKACKELAMKQLEADTGFRILLDLVEQTQTSLIARKREMILTAVK